MLICREGWEKLYLDHLFVYTNVSIGMKVRHVEIRARRDLLLTFPLLQLRGNPKTISGVARSTATCSSSGSLTVTSSNWLRLVVVAITVTRSRIHIVCFRGSPSSTQELRGEENHLSLTVTSQR